MIRNASGAALCAMLVIGACWGGCGGDGSTSATRPDGGDDGDAGDDSPGFGGDAQAQAIDVEPQNQVLTATGPGATLQYQALVGGAPVQAQWTIDVPSIGTIDSGGLFTTSGLVAGKVTVEATSGKLHGQTQLTVILKLQDNPGNVSPGVQNSLQNGGKADLDFKWLYPYDKTVFPRGLLPPTLQFGGGAPDAVYVHVSFGVLDYMGFYGPSNPGRIDLSPQLWKTITESASGTDDVKVEVTKISGGQVTGPVTDKWRIAQGSLKGTVYYESRYSSPSDNGATMRIKPGAAKPDVLLGNCNVCHNVSADGSTIVASQRNQAPFSGTAYDLTKGAAPIYSEPTEQFTFPALYPDGTVLMSSGEIACGGKNQPACWGPGDVPGTGDQGDRPSRLFDVKTGANIPAAGWDGVVNDALMPAFSPDGKSLVFNRWDTGQGHSLAIASFARSTNTFSNIVDIASDPNHFLGWPTFTPDSQWVVFDLDSRNDFATWNGATSDLSIVHLASKTVAKLDLLNGVDAGNYYLPFGETAEGHMNYDPTVLPEAVGGYYWVVFTTRREFGNTINTADPYYTGNPYDPKTPGTLPWRKKLWVAALDIDDPGHPSASAHDISHPAFYLPGQDLQTGNYRGFWALDPCKQNGNACDSGDECCSGYCRQVSEPDGAVDLVCVPPQGCAHEYEKCATDADCCGQTPALHCIAGHCGQSTPK